MTLQIYTGMDINQDISVTNYMETFYFCHVGTDKLCEHMVKEHTLFHLLSGEMDVLNPNGDTVRLRAGDTVLLRRNHKVSKEKRPAGGKPFNGLFLHLKADFLKQVKKDYKLAAPIAPGKYVENKNVFALPQHHFLQALFGSLVDYFQADEYPSAPIMESKLREAVFVLLQLRPQLASVLFDFAAPYKIDLPQFMEENYRSELTVEEFAHYTGRSLTAFKKEFARHFDLTPQRWLVKRRLQEAYRLIHDEGEKSNDIYLKVGFKNLSHFSAAFKKEFGVNPSQISNQAS